MSTQISWSEQQEKAGIPLIEHTCKVRLPNGIQTEVNLFDYNLKMVATNGESYIQCTFGGWIKANLLTRIEERKS